LRLDETKRCAADLQKACEGLEQVVQQTMCTEASAGAVGMSSRHSKALERAHADLEQHLTRTRSAMLKAKGGVTVESQVVRAEQVLNRFAIWVRFPEILVSIETLRDDALHGNLSEEEKEQIGNEYQDFLEQLKENDIGVNVHLTEGTTTGADGDAALQPLSAAPADQTILSTASFGLGLPESIWTEAPGSDPSSAQAPQAAPRRTRRLQSVKNAVNSALPQWQSEVNALEMTSRQDPQLRAPLLTSEIDHRSQRSNPPQVVSASGGSSGASLLPETATPPNELPGKCVRWFTCGAALWWMFAAAANIVVFFIQQNRSPPPKVADVRTLETMWPGTHGFFQVKSLHCYGSSVWLGSGYSLYTSQMLENGSLGAIAEIGDGAMAAVLCADDRCDGLSIASDATTTGGNVSSFILWSIPQSRSDHGTPQRVLIPPSWRLLAGAWACSKARAEIGLCGRALRCDPVWAGALWTNRAARWMRCRSTAPSAQCS